VSTNPFFVKQALSLHPHKAFWDGNSEAVVAALDQFMPHVTNVLVDCTCFNDPAARQVLLQPKYPQNGVAAKTKLRFYV